MQIMLLTKTNHRQLLEVVCCAVLTLGPAVGHACKLAVKVGSRPSVELNGKKLKIEPSLKNELKAADGAAVLPVELPHGDNESLKWLVLRTPSRFKGAAGYCGAGHEDRLVLLRVSGTVAHVGGEYLAQSCLSSVTMDVDELPELVQALNQDAKTGSLNFQQTYSDQKSSTRQAVTIIVQDGKMNILSRALDED